MFAKHMTGVGDLEIIEQDGRVTYRMVAHGSEEDEAYFNLVFIWDPTDPNARKPRGDIEFKKLVKAKVTVTVDVGNASQEFSTTIPQ